MVKKDCINYSINWCNLSKYVVTPYSIMDCDNCNRYTPREEVNQMACKSKKKGKKKK